MATNITFGGKEAEQISPHELETIVKMFDGGEPQVALIIENVEAEKMEAVFGRIESSAPSHIPEKAVLYGTRIIKRRYVPLNEIWFVDKKGIPIRKFKI